MRTKKINIKATTLYMIAYLFVLATVSESRAETNNGVVIPYINFNTTYLLLAVIGLGVIYTLMTKKIKVDIIMGFLFLRIVMCIIPVLTTTVSSHYLGNFVVACFPFFIYFFMKNCKVDVKKATSVFRIFGIVVAIECIIAYFTIVAKGLANYNDLFYKAYFVTPAGATNDLSAILLTLFIVGDSTIEKKLNRFSYDALLLVAIFLCKSRTGMILAVCYILYRLIMLLRNNLVTVKKIAYMAVPCVIVIAVGVLLFTPAVAMAKDLFLGFSSEGGGLDSLMSGRLSIIKDSAKYIAEHPFFGNGVDYEQMNFIKLHNAFFQIAYENGIIGLVGFVAFLVICVKKIIKCRNLNAHYRAFFIAIPFIFVNAMVEDSLITTFMILFALAYLSSMDRDLKESKENV